MSGPSNVTRLQIEPVRAVVINKAHDDVGGFLIGAMKRGNHTRAPQWIGGCYRAMTLDAATSRARDLSQQCGLPVRHGSQVTA